MTNNFDQHPRRRGRREVTMENATSYSDEPDYYEPYPTGWYPTEGWEGDECGDTPWPQSWAVFATLYCLIFVTGCLGNGLLVLAIALRGQAKRQLDIFVVNLAVADLIFLLTLPLWVDVEVSGKSWRSGLFLCRLSVYVVAVNAYSSVFFLTCMSLDRYLAIVRPGLSRVIRSKTHATLACVGVWVASLLLGLRALLNRTLQTRDGGRASYCVEDPGSFNLHWSLAYLVLTFFCPLLAILACYCSITRKLCLHYRSSNRQDQKLRKSIRVVFLAVAAFLVSWLPFNLFKSLSLLVRWGAVGSCGIQRAMGLGLEASAPLAFANSCANPIIYYLYDSSIQRAVMDLLRPLGLLSAGADSQTSRSLSSTLASGAPAHKTRSVHHVPMVSVSTWASDPQA
uniref:G-protein coupled receptor 15-like n=1 Tax=Pristiophorus japonicus TaxID=55135 RepID=UPI00398EFBEB